MKVLIMGCGRVSASLAVKLDMEGHDVTVLDIDSFSFRRLPASFKGKALVGNGIDEDVLRKSGIENMDVFLVLTQGDNRNILAAQIAKHTFNVKRVICRIYDPLRQEMYEKLGLESISPTTIISDLLKKKLED